MEKASISRMEGFSENGGLSRRNAGRGEIEKGSSREKMGKENTDMILYSANLRGIYLQLTNLLTILPSRLRDGLSTGSSPIFTREPR